METEYVTSEDLLAIKKCINDYVELGFDEVNFIKLTNDEVEFFVKNISMFNKVKNHFDITYSEKTKNPNFFFVGSIPFANYYFLWNLRAVISGYYSRNEHLDNDDVDKGFEYLDALIKLLEDNLSEDYYFIPTYQNLTDRNDEYFDDLSDTSITEKIIYLKKLGIIEFLKAKQPFLSSTNSLATVLSAVTGAKASTIQSMINPMFSKNVDDKNNPMNSQKTVEKVQKQLNKIGFNLDETI